MSLQKILFCCLLFNFLNQPKIHAEIIPDNSLGNESSTVTPQDAITDLIEGGAIRDNNLFHSFTEFSIPAGDRVYFASPDGIANILTRVTGNNISKIFGTLGVLNDTPPLRQIGGGTNLFLLNPNGIIFGENASLDINGSFLATTADSYIFENGFEYSASNPEIPPLLTINIPVGLQFGSNSAKIDVQGPGRNLILNPLTFEFLFRDAGAQALEVPLKTTLALIGGEINLKGGNLGALQGRIELGSVAEQQNVLLIPTEDGYTFDYQNIANFRDINLTESASIDVSGNGGGNIQIQGKNIHLSNSSAIISTTLGNQDGGIIQISASENFEIIDAEGGLVPSGIFNQVDANAIGNGSSLNIEAGRIELSGYALINSSVSGAGNGGEIYIKTGDFILNGISDFGNQIDNLFLLAPTGIFSQVSPVFSTTGNSSNITVEANNIEMTNGAIIATATLGTGDSGDINITTDSLELSGTGSFLLLPDNPIPSGIFTTVALSIASGNGGNIAIDTGSLTIFDGGQIRAGTFGSGESGNIVVKAEDISVSDVSIFFGANVSSGIFASSGLGILTGEFQQTTGDGGNIDIETENLTLTGGGQIGTGTSSTGSSGNLTIEAQDVTIIGQSLNAPQQSLTAFGNTSGLFSSVIRSDSLGSGGDIVVNTTNLQIDPGGAIAANVFGVGSGGDIQINAEQINVSDSFVVSGIRTGITTTVETTGVGDAGDIRILSNSLNLTNGGSIAASTLGNGNAGDIELQASTLNLQGVSPETNLPSQITAFSQGEPNAGEIDILAPNLVISDRATISVSNLGQGDSGNINLNSQKLTLNNQVSLAARVNSGNQGNINLTTDRIFLTKDSEISAQATGTATGGNIIIQNQDTIVLQDHSQIIADSIQGDGGKVEISTRGFFVSPDSLVSASSQFGLDGTVEIDILENQNQQIIENRNYELIAINKLIKNRCFGSNSLNESSFTYIGRGSTPVNPETRIDEDYYVAQVDNDTPQIVEANAIGYNRHGNIVLLSLSLSPNLHDSGLTMSNNCLSK